jgi:hypothetical protein
MEMHKQRISMAYPHNREEIKNVGEYPTYVFK